MTHLQEADHRRSHAAVAAARIGQSTGALPALGGVAALAPGYLAGARAGLTGLVMASTFRAHPPGLLAIAAHGTGGADGAWTGRRQDSPRDIPRYSWVRSRPGP